MKPPGWDRAKRLKTDAPRPRFRNGLGFGRTAHGTRRASNLHAAFTPKMIEHAALSGNPGEQVRRAGLTWRGRLHPSGSQGTMWWVDFIASEPK